MAVPEGHVVSVGEAVKAKYFADKPPLRGCASFKNKFYKGSIMADKGNGKFDIHYDDGSQEESVLLENLK
eukprot:5862270-Pleurochrysis_carterae.AAC.1